MRTAARPLALAAIRVAALALGMVSLARAQFAVSQLPFQVTPAPPANIVLTIDDSGSMTNAYVPDSVGGSYSTTLAFTSSDYNRLYYNPSTTYVIPPDATGLPASQPSFTAAWIDGFNSAAGSVNLASAYQPTLQYAPGSGNQNFASPTAATGMAAYYYIFQAGAGCATPVAWQAPPPDACFAQVLVGATSGPGATDERQNFANWYSFYRTRHLAIASSAAIAMSDPGLSATRIAWQGLTSCADFTSGRCQGWDASVAAVDNRIRSFIGQHRTDFFTWLFRVPAANSTPTRQAWWRTGEYFRTKGPNSPYGLDPNNSSTSTVELACVSNFQVTLTDGQWNTSQETQTNFCGNGTCANSDGSPQALPDGTSYVPGNASVSSTSIYADYNTGGLADIAFYYWATNLRPDLTGTGTSFVPSVPPYTSDPSTLNPLTGRTDAAWPYWNPRNDPATWPHLVNYTIGVGLTGYLTLPGLNWVQDSFGGNASGSPLVGNGFNGYTDLARLDPLACATPAGGTAQVPFPDRCNWPWISPNGNGGVGGTGANGANGAGGGGGGGGGNAGNVYDLWHAAIDSRGQAFSAESPQDLVTALHIIMGQIEGRMRGNSGVSGSSASLTTSSALFVGSYDANDWHGTLSSFAINGPASASPGSVAPAPTWQTTNAGSIPPFASRNVVTAANIVPLAGQVMPGTTGTAFSGSNQAALAGAGIWSWVGAAPLINYLLGDASNELPAGARYRARPVTKLGDIVDSPPLYSWTEDFGYAALSGSAAMPEAASYGAFLTSKSARPAMVYVGANDGMLHGFDALTGVERFAYVPHVVVPAMAALANPNYAHAFLVDGQSFVGDAFINTGGGPAWHSVLVGATGAGGKGVFALDVGSPASFGPASLLWDMDGTATPPGGTGPWGNSDPDLGDTIGQPIIARMNDGNWYAIFGNGYLSMRACPVLYLVRLDTGLATRIDASGQAGAACTAAATKGPNGLGSPALYDDDNNGTTDFIYAGDLLGNLWKFDVRATSASGWVVAFGTGRPLFTATSATGVAQAIVAAPNIGPGPAGPMIYFATGRAFAVGDAADTSQQSVYGIADTGVALGARGSRGNRLTAQPVTPAPDGSGNAMVAQNAVLIPAAQDGWVIDLPGAGERVTQTPTLAGGVLLFSSLRPTGTTCGGGGCTSFLYAVRPVSGAGGLGFLHLGTSTYDAILSTVGCIAGVTTVTNRSELYIYWIGNQPVGGTSTPGSPGPGTPPPPPPPGTPPPPTCPDPFGCTNGTMTATGRTSWQELIP